jgi:hypothetical protein
VLSTTNFKLCFGDFDKPAISATSNNGLLTVSQYKTFVSGMAASTASSLYQQMLF